MAHSVGRAVALAEIRTLVGAGLRCLQDGDRQAALRWFAQAEKTEDPSILADLGGIYDQLMNDVARAESCYRRAANGGSITAMNNLGVLLKNSDRLDEAEAFLRRAAASGDADALNSLGNVLERRGDVDQALDFWRQAARAGHTNAMCTLGIHLVLTGYDREAREWYQQAKARRNPQTQAQLTVLAGLLSERGSRQTSSRGWFRRALARRSRPYEGSPPSRSRAGADQPVITIDSSDPGGSADRARVAYLKSGDPAILEFGVHLARLAVEAGSPGDPDRVANLATLGVLLRLTHEHGSNPETLAEAVETGRAAVAAASPSDPAYPMALTSLGHSLVELFGVDDDQSHLAEAAGLYREVLRAIPPEHPMVPGVLSDRGNALLAQAISHDDAQLLDEAISAGRMAVRNTRPGDPHSVAIRCNLAVALTQRCGRTRSLVELNEVQELYASVLKELPPRHPARPKIEEAARQAALFAARLRAAHGGTSPA